MNQEREAANTAKLPASALKVQDAARAAGLSVRVREMDASTRSAQEAAAACGCAVAQIVKSLVFQGKQSGAPFLLLVSGKNQVDMATAGRATGEPLSRPDADYVRRVTGFAIGGIPPLGHAEAMATLFDEDLLGYDTVYAAAGMPRCVFAVDPRDLAQATGGHVVALARN